MQKYALIFATLFLTVAGQLIIKWRATTIMIGTMPTGKTAYVYAMFVDLYVWCGLAGAVLASICWMLALQQTALSVAYPFMALTFLFVPLGATFLFGETLSVGQYIGLSMIMSGIAVSALWR